MILKSIALRDYRNFTSEKVEFCEGSNIISGKNAQGKTNLMESVWLFTSGRSFRTPNEKEFDFSRRHIGWTRRVEFFGGAYIKGYI